MPLGVNPVTVGILAVAGAVTAAGSYMLSQVATKAGSSLKGEDLLPMMPWEGPPLPRFVKTKPEVLKEVLG